MTTLVPLLALLACARRIPEPASAALAAPAPPESIDTKLCWIEFATGVLPRRLTVARGALEEDLVSTASGLLLERGEQRWLIDGGAALELEPSLRELPPLPRALLRRSARDWARVATPQEALAAAGVAPETLTGAIPTHIHYDHLGGLLELQGPPIVLPEAEIAAARRSASGEEAIALPAEARALLPRARPLLWEDAPFLAWEQRHDLFGDGSVVLVPMPGHSPGSLGVWARLPDGRALLLVGDTVWAREGYEQREPRSWVAGSFDDDGPANDAQIAKLWMLHRMLPELIIVPAHDRRQWEAAFGAPGCVEPGGG